VLEVQSESEIEHMLLAFQERFPFHKMHVDDFLQILFSLNKERLTVEDLSHKLKGKEWGNADVFNLILALPDTDVNGEIDICSLICLGLLWC
jgi:hypothetical protein